MPHQVEAVILAAGEGKRIKSKKPKVLHQVCGRPMISYVVEAVRGAGIDDIIVVISPEGEEIKSVLGGEVRYVYQRERLGTGHALLQAREAIGPEVDTVLVLAGDTPLLKADLLAQLVETHGREKGGVTVVTTQLSDPTGYGRIVRDSQGNVESIVEETDASPEEKEINEVNSGVYAFAREQLFWALDRITPANAQGEYYLPQVLEIFRRQGLGVAAVKAQPETVLGINNRKQLAQVEEVLGRAILEGLMLEGVTIIDPSSTFIDAHVEIGWDTIIYPFTIIRGNTRIGEDCRIGPSVQIDTAIIGDAVTVENSVLKECKLRAGARVGPFAYLRPGTVLDEGAKAGTFVEIKKSILGKNSKVPHLSYVGDTIMGEDVNIGAGTITCNYDGWAKHETRIDGGAFIGSNTNLVAPVHIGRKAVTGAGSTITKDVPDYALALERCQQINIPDWVKKKLQKMGYSSDEEGE